MASRSFGDFVEHFLTSVSISVDLPPGISVLRPYDSNEVRRVVHAMCTTYYGGARSRLGVWGINPGRYGAGLTGLSFTDPWAVKNDLGIETDLSGRREISAEFVSKVMHSYGGAHRFYEDVYLTALCPLGFVKDGNNINFYDDSALQDRLAPQMVTWMQTQLEAGLHHDAAIVLGTGKLRRFVEDHIRRHVPFTRVVYLEHPRYIMQYRRKYVDEYVQKYVETIASLTLQH